MNLRPVARSMPWVQWAALAPLLGLLLLAYRGLPEGFFDRQFFARGGLLVAAVAMSFSFDDAASPTNEPSPVPLRVRRMQRAVLALGPWIASVAVVVGGAMCVRSTMPGTSTTGMSPFYRLMLEAATIAALGLATAAFASKHWDEQPGRIAAPTLVGLYALSWALPHPFRPWSVPNLPGWEESLVWWWIALALGLCVGVVASWDSRSRTPGTALRGLTHRGDPGPSSRQSRDSHTSV